MTEGMDIAETPDAIALQRAIATVPDDDAPQLVLADLLQSVGDPRGELIVLDLRERVGDLIDRDGITRLLFLAAEYSFPRAQPEEPAHPFTGYGSRPPRYATHYKRVHYDLRFRGGVFELVVDAQLAPVLATPLATASKHDWTDGEAALILRLVGDAIRAGTPLDLLVLPFAPDPLPVYDGGPLRGYRLPKRFREQHALAPDRFGLAPRDYHRWMRLWSRIA